MSYLLTRREAFRVAAGAVAGVVAALRAAPDTCIVPIEEPVHCLQIESYTAWRLRDGVAFSDWLLDYPVYTTGCRAIPGDLPPAHARIAYRALRGELGERRGELVVRDFPLDDDGSVELPHGFTLHLPEMAV